MVSEKIVESVLDSARPGWRERKAKRKSPWNLVCVLLGFGMTGVYWFLFFQIAWYVHVLFYPSHANLKDSFWGDGISLWAFIPSFLMVMPLGLPALVAGLLSGNCLVWLIPPARRAMNLEAQGDRELTFKGANAGLIKWGKPIFMVCFALSFIGMATLKHLK